jgi:ABC-type sulfate transport system permease component
MNKSKHFFRQFLHDGHLGWLFIIPSSILLALFVLPLFAVIVRSIDANFFNTAFSEQAFKALRLSLVTSSVSLHPGALDVQAQVMDRIVY